MAKLEVNLVQEELEALRQAQRLLTEGCIPWLVDQLKSEWPVDTGKSRSAWRGTRDSIRNDVDYSEYIRAKGGLAVETVLDSILSTMQNKVWKE